MLPIMSRITLTAPAAAAAIAITFAVLACLKAKEQEYRSLRRVQERHASSKGSFDGRSDNRYGS
jgi:hypothetical protein